MNGIDSDALPTDPLQALRELSRIELELAQLRRDRVAAARSQGATWAQVGESLGVSRQSAWEYYSRPALRMLDRQTARPGTPDEAEVMPTVVDAVTEVRRARRPPRS